MAFDAFALILAMLALGMAFARLKVLPANAAETLNLVVLYVCLPAAVLIYVPRLHVDASLAGVIITPWLLAVSTAVLVMLATRAFKFRRDETALLYDLIQARMMATLVITAWRAALYPGNAGYILRNAPSARRGLAALRALGRERATETIARAAGQE